MLGNDRIGTASQAVTLIRRRNDRKIHVENSSIFRQFWKVESTSKFLRRIDVIVSKWFRPSKSMKSRRTFRVKFDVETMANRRRCVHWVVYKSWKWTLFLVYKVVLYETQILLPRKKKIIMKSAWKYLLRKSSYQTETGQLIFKANQFTGSYIIKFLTE